MTTGSYSFGSKSGTNSDWIGDYTTRAWSGADRPTIPKGTPPEERKRLASIPHPYTASIARTVSPPITIQLYQWVGTGGGSGYWNKYGKPYSSNVPYSFGAPNYPSDPWSSNHDLQLLTNLKEQVFNGSANMSVTLAEMKETLGSITSIAKRINALLEHAVTVHSLSGRKRRRYMQTLVRRTVRNRPIRTMGDYWLEWRYAVRPALLDLDSHCEMLAYINNKPARTKYHAKHKAVASGTWRGGSTSTTHRARAVVEVTTKANNWLVWSGVTDPASVLWEKIPYSFVVDWVLPVGNFLSAVDFWRKVEGTFVITHKVTKQANGCFGNDGARVIGGGGGYSQTLINLDRMVTSNPPIPYPTLDLSIRQVSTALKRAVDAVALFGLPRRL